MDWPFADPQNVAVFTSADVIDRRMPIIYVWHHEDDGAWEFQSVNGAPDDTNDARLVALREVLDQDPTVGELADLPFGWSARRDRVGGKWLREPFQPRPD